MAKIELTDKQLRMIQDSLELYSRVGILQHEHILDHPDIDNLLYEKYASAKKLAVGVDTMRGEVVEIGDGYVKTKGSWGNGEEIRTWTDVENIKISPNWNQFHQAKDRIRSLFAEVNRLLLNDPVFPQNASLGGTDPSRASTKAFDMVQVIRHEWWKINPNRTGMTVDSSINLWSGEPAIKVELDNIKDIRKQKLDEINKK